MATPHQSNYSKTYSPHRYRRKNMKRFKWALLLTFISTIANSEHVVWDKTPIHINLSLNQERLVRFPQAIQIIESEAGDKVSVLKIQDALYIKAKEAIDKKRLLVQLMPQGEVIILSLST